MKRQAAIALRCIQALVKIQAQSRAKHVRIASENQSVQQKLMQQLEVEAPAPAPVKKPQVRLTQLYCFGIILLNIVVNKSYCMINYQDMMAFKGRICLRKISNWIRSTCLVLLIWCYCRNILSVLVFSFRWYDC